MSIKKKEKENTGILLQYNFGVLDAIFSQSDLQVVHTHRSPRMSVMIHIFHIPLIAAIDLPYPLTFSNGQEAVA